MIYDKKEGCVKNWSDLIYEPLYQQAVFLLEKEAKLKQEFFDWYESFFSKEADLTKVEDLDLFNAYKAGRNKK